MEIKYSEQANVMIEQMKDFNKEDFEKWFNKSLSIGSNNILEYLVSKKRLEIKKAELEKQLKDSEGGLDGV